MGSYDRYDSFNSGVFDAGSCMLNCTHTLPSMLLTSSVNQSYIGIARVHVEAIMVATI